MIFNILENFPTDIEYIFCAVGQIYIINKTYNFLKYNISTGNFAKVNNLQIPKPEVSYSFGSNFYITSCSYLYKIMLTGEVLKFQFKLPKNIEFLIGLNNQLYAKAGVTFYLLDIVNRQINQVQCQPTFTSKVLASVHQNDTKRPKCYIFDSQHIYEAVLSQNQIITIKIQDLLISDDKIKVYMYLHYILIILTSETLMFDTRGRIFRQCSLKFSVEKNYAVINEFLVSSTGEYYNFNNIMLNLQYKDQLHIAKIHRYNSYLQDIQLNLFDNVNGQITIGNGFISNQKDAYFTDQGLNCFFYRISLKNFSIHFYDQAYQFGFGALYCQCNDDVIVINQYNQVIYIKSSRQMYQLCELSTEQYKPRAFAAGCQLSSNKIFIHGGLIIEDGSTSDEGFILDVLECKLTNINATSEIYLHGHKVIKVKNKILIMYGSRDITYQNLNPYIFEAEIQQIKQPVSNNDKLYIDKFQQVDYGMLRLGIYGFDCIYLNKYLFIMGASMGFCQKEITDIIVYNLQEEEFKILQDKIYFAPYQKFTVIHKQIVSTRQKFDYEKIIDSITYVKETQYTTLQTNFLQIKQNKKSLKNTDMMAINVSLSEYNKILQNNNSLLTNNIIQPQQVELIGSGAILYFNVNNYQKFSDIVDQLDLNIKMKIFDQLLQMVYFLGSIDIYINKKLWYDLYIFNDNLYLLPNECLQNESKDDYLKIINQIYIQVFTDQQLKFHSPFYQLYDLNYFDSLNINQSVKIIQDIENIQDVVKAQPRNNKYVYMVTDINEMYTLKQYFTLFEVNFFNMPIRDICKYILPLQTNNVSFKPNKMFCPQFYYLLIDQNNYKHVHIIRKMHQILGQELKNMKDVTETAEYYQIHQDQCKLAYNLLQLNYFIEYQDYIIVQDESSYLQKAKSTIPKFIIGLMIWLAGTTKIYFKKGEKQCRLEVNSFFCAGKTEEQFLDLLSEWYCSQLVK